MSGSTTDSNARAQDAPRAAAVASAIPNPKSRILPSAARQKASSLITTLLVLVVLSTIVVAFMQSMSIERSVARSAMNVVQADLAATAGADRGVQEIYNSIVGTRTGPDQWSYISGHLKANPAGLPAPRNADATTFAFITRVDPTTGTPQSTNFLFSQDASFTTTAMIPLGSSPQNPAYPARWVPLVAAGPSGQTQTNARFAFWISDDTTKLPLAVVGRKTTRSFGTDTTSIALMVRENPASTSASTIPVSATASFATNTLQRSGGVPFTNWTGNTMNRPQTGLMTIETLRQVISGAGINVPNHELENDISFDSLSAPVSPEGKPKVNLMRLKSYLDSLPRSQSLGNLRAAAVIDILDASKTATHKNWGGGDFSFLVTKMGGKYSMNEARQIVANIFDAIDDDFIPTCDNRDDPTFLGAEFRRYAGSLQGHPVITYVGTGHFANNSRVRTHMAVGFANPWPSPTLPWPSSYEVELEVTPSHAPFPSVMNEQLTGMPASVRDPNSQMLPFSGGLFPCVNSSVPHYSAFVNAAPTAIANLTFTVRKVDLIFEDSSGGKYLVARVPPGQVLQALPSNIPANGDGANRLAWQNGRQALWAQSDPRVSSLSSSNWTVIPNGAGGALGIVPAPASEVVYMASATTGDGAQGLSRRLLTTMTSASPDNWFRATTSLTNHFAMDDSLVYAGNGTVSRIQSLGFMGFLSAAKPWQTLSFSTTNNPPGQEDWKIIDYAYAGSEKDFGSEIIHSDLSPSSLYGTNGARATFPGAVSKTGAINVNNANFVAWRALMEGIPGVSAGNAQALATQFASRSLAEPSTSLASFISSIDLSGGATTDFEKEKTFRYLADALTDRSRSFTIYSMGEAIQVGPTGVKVTSRAMRVTRLRIDLDSATGGIRTTILESKPY